MFKLVISDDEGKTTVVPLVRDEITIGRKEGNTIRLTERNVSRRHARLRKVDGVYILEDLNSYNGVKINGRRIEGERPLAEGDQVTIGDYVLAVQSDAGAGAEAPTAVAPGAGPAPPARLVMLTPPAPGAEFALTRSGMRIGRAEDLDVWVNHRSISREHAEVRLEGEAIKLVDLGSANGVRLNGEDVREALLKSGDVLELGQVRFRYVGAGEAYVFEADRTVQMDALHLPEEPTSSKVPLIAAAVIVLVAVGVGAAIALSGGETVEPTGGGAVVEQGTPPPADPAPPGAGGGTDPAAAAIPLVERCRQAVEAGDFEAARAAASQALELAPGHAGATQCASDAQAAGQIRAAFDRGVEALEAERYDEAYFAFEELPEDSPLRRRPEVQLARDRFASFSLERATEALASGDRALATSYANNVLSVPDLPAHFQNAANDILRQAERPGPTQRMGVTARRPPRMRERPSGMVERSSAPPASEMQPTAMGGAVDPSTVLRECSYNQRCVARRLAGRANTPRAMGVLIEAYKAIGDSGAARRTIEQLIGRFPNSRQANQYRRQL